MAGELVLIVEDNERNRKLARDVLQFRGFRTIEAVTGREALLRAAEHSPDIILMDIQLPDMTGTEALGRLGAVANTASIPVVALTAFAMREDRDRLLAAGFDGYIAKPIDIKQFPDQVRQFCPAGAKE
jgi:two-component system, cell cycle response regulator DivK